MNFTVELNETELNLILESLAEMPAKKSFFMISKLQNIANVQMEKEKELKESLEKAKQ